MKLYRVAISPRAREDLNSITHYLCAETSAESASRVLEAIEHAVLNLSAFPDRYPASRESDQLRQVVCKNYRILFRVGRSTVTVVAVVHAAQRHK
jgi:plasmid stabilization system protein ParE